MLAIVTGNTGLRCWDHVNGVWVVLMQVLPSQVEEAKILGKMCYFSMGCYTTGIVYVITIKVSHNLHCSPSEPISFVLK